MNKKQLKQEIVKVQGEYLGFGLEGVVGLSSMTKNELENELKECKRALRFKKYANKIKIDRLKGYFAKEGSKEHDKFLRVQLLMALANRLWLKTPYELAKKEVRKQMGHNPD